MKRIVVICCFICVSLLSGRSVFAVDCTSSDPCAGKSVEESVTCYQQVVDSCRDTRNTLSSQITYFNNQIQLTTFQIQSIKGFIANLTKEINQLADEVVILEGKLTKQTELLQKRVPESYKEYVKSSDFTSLMFSKNIGDLVARIQYIKKVQQQDLKLFVQYKATQNNYAERKTQREEKKAKQEAAQRDLELKNAQLAGQKREKNALLEVTQGNEATYQQLLYQAKIQAAAMKGFVSSVGGTTILSNQTFCSDWGCYYSQRDSAWANNRMGSSSETILNVGCYITSVAMVATHYKKDIKPSDIAAESTAFVFPTAYMRWSYAVKGISVNLTSISSGTMDSELAAGRPVIVGLRAGPAHFIVIKSGSGGQYVMNDPVVENGHDISFSSHYSTSDITQRMSVNIN